MMHRHEAVKPAPPHHVHPRLRHPAALLISHSDHVAGADAQPVRVAEAGREHVQLPAVGADADQRTAVRRALGALCEIKVAARVGLETRRVCVPAARREQIVVEAFVKVRLAVAVEVVQTCDLVASDDVGIATDHLQAKRLKQAGREAAPRHFFKRRVDVGEPPHVAVHGADQRRAVRQKIVAGREQQRVPRVVERQPDRVDGERAARLADDAPRGQRRPQAGAALGQARRRFDGGVRLGQRHDGLCLAKRRLHNEHLGQTLGCVGLDRQQHAVVLHRQAGALAKRDDPERLVAGGEVCHSQAVDLLQHSSRSALGGDQAGQRLGYLVKLECAREKQPAIGLAGPRRLEHPGFADGVAEHHPVAVPVQAAVPGPVARERTELALARVGQFAGMRPARRHAVGEQDAAFWFCAPGQAVSPRIKLEEAARPRRAVAEQFGVETDRGLRRVTDLDGNALERAPLRRVDGSAHERPDIGLVPSSVRPVLLDLVGHSLHRGCRQAGFFRLAKRVQRAAKRQHGGKRFAPR